MKIRHYSTKLTIFSFVFLLSINSLFAQKAGSATPRQEKLLNGLKVLMWSEPKSDKVSIKIRIHSGSSFDQQQKEGTMRLLADNIFPTEAAKEFFTEELGGSLDVTCNYDYIQISASGQADRVLDIVQTLAAAITAPAIDKETTVKLRTALLTKVTAMEKDPAYIADRAATKRLFGSFPYGRPEMGSTTSVPKIEFADLLDAKQRFLTADNATVTITGNYNSDLVFRAVRRYFGAWLKSDKKTPSTFRQPDDPDTSLLALGNSTPGNTEIRYALRGLARGDKDYPASEILTRIALARWQATNPVSSKAENYTLRNESHILPGYLMFGLAQPPPAVAKLEENLIPKNITAAEFAKAKADVIAGLSGKSLQERWLDVDTYKGLPVDNETAAYQDATLADVQRVADRLRKNPVVTVHFTTPADSVAGD
jgi:predicted Zn-dependent peptidase